MVDKGHEIQPLLEYISRRDESEEFLNSQIGSALEKIAPRPADKSQVAVRLDLDDASAMYSANNLIDFDREMRRAAGIVKSATGSQSPQVLYEASKTVLPARPTSGSFGPVHRKTGHLDVYSATSGSLHFVLLAYDLVEELLLNSPLQMIATLDWLWSRMQPRRGAIRSDKRPRSMDEIVDGLFSQATEFVSNNPGATATVQARISRGELDVQFTVASADGRI